MSGELSLLAARLTEGVVGLPAGAFSGGIGAVLVALALFLGARRRRRQGHRSRPRRAASPQTAHRESARAWTARALVQGGADITEVARRTGMTREAVRLAVHTTRTPDRSAP